MLLIVAIGITTARHVFPIPNSIFNLILLCLIVGCTAGELDTPAGTEQVAASPQLIPSNDEQISGSLSTTPHKRSELKDGDTKVRFEIVTDTWIDFDLDGDLDAIASVNMGKAVLLKNKSQAAPSLSIKLKGLAGNSRAIGAQLRVKIKDAAERLLEVRSGGSYLSQSQSRITLPGVSALDIDGIEVRWPDGSETRWESDKPLAADDIEIVVEQPE